MSRLHFRLLLLPFLGLLLLAPSLASAEVEVSQVDWQTIEPNVRFHIQFHNPDPTLPSDPVSGQVHAQDFGAFLPNEGLIGDFTVPQMAPDSFFDVFFDIDVSLLPPSAETILPGGGGTGSTAPGVHEVGQVLCPPPTFWNGNVDIFWSGPGGTGTVNYHFGELQICPDAEPSYIHVILGCDDPAGISWSFAPACAGWIVTLVEDSGFGSPAGPAPNPIPSGFWDGWICISATNAVPVGNTCSIDLNMTCGGETSTINVMAEACEWEPATPAQPSTWGEIKLRSGKTAPEGN